MAASDTATHRGRPSSWARVRPVPSTPITVLVASTTRPNPTSRSPSWGRVARSSRHRPRDELTVRRHP
jgi:hypothetical protein